VTDTNILGSTVWKIVSNLSPWLISFILFTSLYRWVPKSEVSWRAALWTGAVVMLLWQLTAMGFRWYLSSGMTNYEVVYGSLSAIVVLLLWIYISSLLIFFGAHLCAAINQPR
jgi:membrane protein